MCISCYSSSDYTTKTNITEFTNHTLNNHTKLSDTVYNGLNQKDITIGNKILGGDYTTGGVDLKHGATLDVHLLLII